MYSALCADAESAEDEMMDSSRTYVIKESARARRVWLKMTLQDGLVVVVPRGFNRDRIPRLVESKGDWVDKTARRMEEERRLRESAPTLRRPDRLILRAIGEEWAVQYVPTDLRSIMWEEQSRDNIVFYGCTDDADLCRSAMQRWLHGKAHGRLVPWLRRMGAEEGLTVNRVTVRAQRSRWASCSGQGTISLNRKLLFLPQEMVRYVLIHELCHTLVPNHSARFWATVLRHAPDYKAHQIALRSAWRFVPAWIEGGRIRQ